jgi:hypothetical protein
MKFHRGLTISKLFFFFLTFSLLPPSDLFAAESNNTEPKNDLIFYKQAVLKDALYRLGDIRNGLIRIIRPMSLEVLNYKPGGKTSTVRQLVNHLACFEKWMVERIRRAEMGDPDLDRNEAETFLPDIGKLRPADFLTHGRFKSGDPEVDSQVLIDRLRMVRAESHGMLANLEPDDLFKPIINPVDEKDRNILNLINHIVGHELIHIGSILTIRGLATNPEQ